MSIELITFVETHWQDVKDFANSVFFTAIVGSLAGAFAGAYGAQLIAKREENRKQLLNEIRNTNAAIMVVFGICNSLLGIKSQYVKSLKETFNAQKTALLDHKKKRDLGQLGKDIIFEYQADFQTLSLPPLPTEILQNQIFEKLSAIGRPLILATTLSQTIHSLNTSLEKRNQLIEFYKTKSFTQDTIAHLYFGLPDKDGHINQDYPATIDAIYSQTDDGAFFSQLLCTDLVKHGEQIATQFTKQFGKGVPTINKPDFAKAEKSGLMPKAEHYADWELMFIKKPH